MARPAAASKECAPRPPVSPRHYRTVGEMDRAPFLDKVGKVRSEGGGGTKGGGAGSTGTDGCCGRKAQVPVCFEK